MFKNLVFLVIFFAFSNLLNAQIYQADKAHAEVSGETTFVSYTGASEELQGKLNLETRKVDFEIPLKSIDTGNNLRNKHMNEALESSKYPTAKFSGEIISAFDPTRAESQEVKVKGNFTIHGETREITVTAKLVPKKSGIDFSAEWPINITDYKMERPKVMFSRVDDKHTISIKGTLSSTK